MAKQSSLRTLFKFLRNLIKMVAWADLGDLHPYTQGDEPRRIAREFAEFAKNGFMQNIIIAIGKVAVDRSTNRFDARFVGGGWSIWKGPADGDGLIGDEDQDQRALALTEVDVIGIIFETALRDGEISVKGEEKLQRLRESGRILLDAQFAQTLLKEPGLVTLEMLRLRRGITWLDFPGTVLRNPFGYRCLLFLRWRCGEWVLGAGWLGDNWYASNPSAVQDLVASSLRTSGL